MLKILRQIWQLIKDFVNRLFTKKSPPIEQKLEKSDAELEVLFMQILEIAYQGGNPQQIDEFCQKNAVDLKLLEQWLIKFGERLLLSPSYHQELADRMLSLNEVYQGEIGKIASGISGQLMTYKPDEIGIYLETGKEKFNDGNWAGAIIEFDKILALKPDHEQALINKGIALDELGEKLKSLECFDQVLKNNPNQVDGWYNKGVTLGSMERLEEAIACFQKVTQLQPENLGAWYNLGVAFSQLNQWSESLKYFAQMVEVNPYSYMGWYHYGYNWEMIGNPEKALECYHKSLEIKADYLPALEKIHKT